MGITEAQLEIWAKPGAETTSSNTYLIIRNALEKAGATYSDRTYKIFLQGSYGNTTNIYSESDVDVW